MQIGGNAARPASVAAAKPVAKPQPTQAKPNQGGLGKLQKIGGDVVKNMANAKLNSAASTGQAIVGAVRRGVDQQTRASMARGVDAGVDKLTQSWPQERREALTRTLDTLHRMAGADGMFNHGDIDGIKKDATKNMGVFGRVAAGKVIEKKLGGTLDELGVDPKTKEPADAAARRGLSKEALSGLQDDIDTLKEGFGGDRSALADFLQKHVELGDKPLADGVPSPKDPLAVLETALHALAGARIK